MSNREKYDQIYITIFSISQNDLGEELKYNSIPAWDSIGHMSLMAELEEEFDVMLEMDDIIDFSSYNKGLETLQKYGVDDFE